MFLPRIPRYMHFVMALQYTQYIAKPTIAQDDDNGDDDAKEKTNTLNEKYTKISHTNWR